MNVFLLGLRVTDEPLTEDKSVNVLAEALPSTDSKVATRVQLKQKTDHYVGKLLKATEPGDNLLAIGPTKPTPEGMLIMQPMLVVNKENFDDLLAFNLYVATGGLGPKQGEVQLEETTVTNRSIAWKSGEDETSWMKLSAFGDLSEQLEELPNGTPTIALGKVTSSQKDDKVFLNYTVDKVMYLPRSTRTAPKKAADPEKGKVAAAAIGSLDFDD